ncbi:MAG: ribonuclease J [Alphaproteobacteria bacterium]|nr:ribonuclease J [Alphaproteobacteria bacterium]
MDARTPLPRGAPQDLHFLALGGAGEIGMNLNLYGYRGRWLMVDLGVTFGDDETPGVDVIMPDIAFIEERRDALAGLVLTHAHEDHIGAVQYLWPRLQCPVYATPFTAALLRRKLADTGLADLPITVIPMEGAFSVGPFDLELITLTHSIPEPNAVVIRTGQGTILHTGDWKLDPDPLVGPVADEAALKALGEEGVLALIGDSTNALREGEAGSEGEVRGALLSLAQRCKHRVAVACFASNVARLQTLVDVAEATDRHIALVGRSLWRIVGAARETGYLDRDQKFLDDREAAWLPRDRVLLVCTGSQGEPRAALPRIARGAHPQVTLEAGDACIFSSRIIPGNEKPIARLHDDLIKRGVEVLTERDHFVHVSGHPCRDELVRMYQWVRPQLAIPVHGEHRHLVAHAELARSCQVPDALVIGNGDLVRLAPGKAEIVAQVPFGRLALEGEALLPLEGPSMRTRQRIANHGAVVATLVLHGDGRTAAPAQVAAPGLYDPETDGPELQALSRAATAALDRLSARDRRDDAAVEAAVTTAIRRYVREGRGKRPTTSVHLVRV